MAEFTPQSLIAAFSGTKPQWAGSKGKQRWFCDDCDRTFGLKRAVKAHQSIEGHTGITRGAVQWG